MIKRLDPTLFILTFGVWLALSGASLYLTDDAFAASPIYSFALELNLNDNVMGIFMILIGCVLVCVNLFPLPLLQFFMAALIGLFCITWGCIVAAGAFKIGIISSVATWNCFGGFILLLFSAEHYMRTKDLL